MVTASDFRTENIEHAEAYLQDDCGWQSRVPLNRGRFSYSRRSWSSDKVAVSIVECGVDEVVRASVPSSMVLLHMPQDHADRYQVGRRSLTAAADRAVLLPPNHDYTMRSTAGFSLAFAIDADLLTAALEDHSPGRRGHTLIKPLEARLTEPERLQLFTWYLRFRQLAIAEPMHGEDGSLRALESELVDFCIERILNNCGRQPLSRRNQERVDYLVDWIERHLAEPISVERLAEVAGIGTGGLNRIFKASRSMAPMEFVQSRRLAAARKRMCKANGHTLVSRIALDCGFTHLGRFARSYGQAFGERPSDTLENARRGGRQVTPTR